ncbi:MAG: MFS transporter [Chloroflexi bacterium]|nr:MFS transporter [Chloroflexota bacterium]
MRLTGVFDPLRQNELLLLLCAAQLAQMTSMGIVTPVLPLYAHDFGVGAALVGMVVSAFGLARLIINLPAGQMSERFGRRNLIVAGTLLTTLGVFMSGIANSFPELVAYRFISGLGSGTFTTAAMVFIADITTAQNRARSMSMFQGSLLLGTSIGPAIGGFAAELMGLRAPFFVAALFNLVSLAWAALRIPDTRPPRVIAAAEAKGQAIGKANGTAQASCARYSNGGSLREILGNLNFILICFISFGIFLSRAGGRMTILPLLAYNRLGMSESQVGLTFTGMALLNLMAVPVAGLLADRYGRKAAIVPGTLLAGVAHIIIGFSPNLTVFMPAASLEGIATGIGGPAPAAYVADIAPPNARGLTMGLFRTFSDLAMVAGPVFLGWVAELTDYSWALTLDASVMLSSSILFALFARETLVKALVARKQPAPLQE